MPLFTQESLERLREKLDLVDLLSTHIELKKSGAFYKGRCPFHEEKTPSFMVKAGDRHYHCFGCGAHGDAIQFVMAYLHLPFFEAVEFLAERFHVPLETAEKQDKPLVDRTKMRQALKEASLFFHYYLLHSTEAAEPLRYLFSRNISLDFIKRFEIGLAPKNVGVLRKMLKESGLQEDVLTEAGLLDREGKAEFFRDRITFPIRDKNHQVVGFSARKFKEETFGGKYINSFETPLFKKSKLLFGLNYSLRRILREKKALLVEGQIDCLRLIEADLDFAISALGTAFGAEHAEELTRLGVKEVILLFDGDSAGKNAASKVGDLFQREGMGVKVVELPSGHDPDSFLKAFGKEALLEKIAASVDYLNFQYATLASALDLTVPAQKNSLVTQLAEQIRSWQEKVLVHESLKKLASLAQIPPSLVGVEKGMALFRPQLQKKLPTIDPHKELELDLLRLLLLGEEKEEMVLLTFHYIQEEHLWVEATKKLFLAYRKAYQEKRERDLLSLLIDVGEAEFDAILQKKVKRERFDKQLKLTIQKILDRQWLYNREAIRKKIEATQKEEEITVLMKEFNGLKREVLSI